MVNVFFRSNGNIFILYFPLHFLSKHYFLNTPNQNKTILISFRKNFLCFLIWLCYKQYGPRHDKKFHCIYKHQLNTNCICELNT